MLKYIMIALAVTSLSFAEEGRHPKPHQPPVAQWDVDGDKALTKEEWLARAAHRFDMLDTNKDGKVTREEAEAGLKALHEKRKEKHEDRREERKEERKEAK